MARDLCITTLGGFFRYCLEQIFNVVSFSLIGDDIAEKSTPTLYT